MAIQRNTISKVDRDFARDVRIGLSGAFKSISSKYFYDEKGSALFSEIMKLPEYYLTNAELEIFKERSEEIIDRLGLRKEEDFELIELGAGDGYKTIELIKTLEEKNYQYSFSPIDISQKALDQLDENILAQFPNIRLKPKKGDYFQSLGELNTERPKVLLFLGSNIGNMNDETANAFLIQLSSNLNHGDKLILGTDLKKSKEIVLPAYNDSRGVTREFNLNLLERINRELDANFDLSQFEHLPDYNEEEGIAKSSIQSKIDQEVYIGAIDLKVYFKANECIHTEISRKYDDEIIEKICHNTGLSIIGKLCDSKNYFADYLLEKQ